MAALSPDLEALRSQCGIAVQGAGKIPFICFDLAGGANMAGSNVLIGEQGGQLDFLSTAGYRKLGLPGDMMPSATEPGDAAATSSTRSSASRSTATARSCAACSSAYVAGDDGQHQRRRDPGALRERYRQQSAQPDVRHRARPAPRASC